MTMETAMASGETADGEGLALAAAVFSGEALALPFVPDVLAGHVRSRGKLIFGTREAEAGLYALEHYVAELEAGVPEDYLLMGFDGHGMVSQALHYYLVCGPLALFVQRNHGNPFVGEELGRRRIEGTLGLSARLFDALCAAESGGRLPAGQRLVVVESDFSPSRWGWVRRGGALTLEEDVHALLCALSSVRKLSG